MTEKVVLFGPGVPATFPPPNNLETAFDVSTDSGAHWRSNVKPAGAGAVQTSWNGFALDGPDGNRSMVLAASGCCVADASERLGMSKTMNESWWTHTGASKFSLSSDGALSTSFDPDRQWVWSGVPSPGMNVSASMTASEKRPLLYPIIKLPSSRGYLAGVCIVWNGLQARPQNPDGPYPPLSIVSFKSQNGFNWRYAGVVADARDFTWSVLGPNEHDMAVLSDKKTVMAAIRMDGDGPCSTHLYREFHQSFSTDDGRSWTLPRPISGAGCVRPRLLLLQPAGPLLMSGGRLCTEDTVDTFLWVNSDGLAGSMGGSGRQQWARYSLSYWHNRLWTGNSSYRYSAAVNDTNAWETLGYTSLVQTGASSAIVSYNKYFTPYPKPWPPYPSANFAMGFSLKTDDDFIGAVELDTSNFTETIAGSVRPWVVEFKSELCGTCQQFAPEFAEVVRQLGGRRSWYRNQLNFGVVIIEHEAGMELAKEQGALEAGVPAVFCYDPSSEGLRRRVVVTTEEVVPAKRLKSLVLEAAHELQRGVEGV